MFGKKSDDKKKAQDKDKRAAPQAPPPPTVRAPPQPAAPQPTRVFAPGEEPPVVLGLAVVTLLDICLGRMPNIVQVEQAIRSAGFQPEPDETARSIGRGLALDAKMLAFPLRDLRHKAWRKERDGVPAAMLLTTAQSELGPVVFCAALFGGATEAEAVKTVQTLAKTPPTDGGLSHDADGKVLRRVFWNLVGPAGMALAVVGPENAEARDHLRAVVAFNRAT